MGNRRRSIVTTGALLAVGGLVAGLLPASAATPAAVPTLAKSTQFDITGVIQAASLDGSATQWADAHDGGTITVNGQVVVVPKETVVILPANALTWQELFAKAPAPYGIPGNPGVGAIGAPQSGLALADTAGPSLRVGTYEAHVVGNRVIDPVGTNGCTTAALGYDATTSSCDRYIAGLVDVSQQSLNNGAGYVNYIDYANGVMYVGGQVMPDASLSTTNPGTKIAINDPAVDANGGRFSSGAPVGLTQDARFQVDQDNPTILAETGFPMCLPRTDPSVAVDPLCPEYNRPVVTTNGDESDITPNPNALTLGQHYTLFRMDDPANVALNTCSSNGVPRTCRDPKVQAPFEIGDYVTFAGTLGQDLSGNQFVSAHTIVASLGIYTRAGIDPAYTTVDVSLIGTGGLTIFGAGEATARTRFEGMTTDESRPVAVFGIDIDPTTGNTTDRPWGAAMPDAGPPTGAVRGRWRFRPPCTDTTSTMLSSPGKGCTPPPAGQFIPPTREVRAVVMNVVSGTTPTLTPSNTVGSGLTSANGISYGQYHAPIQEYIFPENVPGTPVPENNFNTIPFLAFGGYKSSTNVQAKVLFPWPSNVLPTSSVCAVANAGGPYTVTSPGTVVLAGSAGSNLTGTVSYSWSAPTIVGATISPNTGTSPTYTAPTGVTGTDTEILTVTQNNAPGCPVQTQATASITVNTNTYTPTVTAPSVKAKSNTGVSGTNPATINGSTDSTKLAVVTISNTATLHSPLTGIQESGYYQFTQVGGPSLGALPGGGRYPATAGSVVSCSTTTKLANGTFSCFAPTASFDLTLPFGMIAPANNPLQFTVKFVLTTKSNGLTGVSSLPISSATSAPLVANVVPNFGAAIALTTVQYRAGSQRLDLSATYTADPNATLKLLPYLTKDLTIFDPASLGNTLTNTGGGIYTLTLVGAPQPYCAAGGATALPCTVPPGLSGPGVVVEAFTVSKTRFEAVSPILGTALTSIR